MNIKVKDKWYIDDTFIHAVSINDVIKSNTKVEYKKILYLNEFSTMQPGYYEVEFILRFYNDSDIEEVYSISLDFEVIE